ncbi:MAG: patatin family protein [Oscillospiraceae bacterium]|nr:patatin family protein [Oscillospiraceae bacterium]
MKQKLGLVMEGGAMRGLFTAGIIDVFLENDIQTDGVAGISAGATFGCNYLTRQLGRPLRYCTRFASDPRFCSYASLLLTGDMYGAEFCYHTIPEELDPIDNDTFVKNGIPFYIACTDVNTGKAIYHRCRDLISRDEMEWVRACASMPLASRIVRVGGYELLDGGIADSIPLKYMEYKGYARNIVILTQPLGYEKGPNSMMPLVRTVYRKYPALIRAMERRHIVYNRQTAYAAQAENEGRAFVIRPPQKLPVEHLTHDAGIMREVYATGRQTAQQLLPALKRFIETGASAINQST